MIIFDVIGSVWWYIIDNSIPVTLEDSFELIRSFLFIALAYLQYLT